MSTVMVSGQTSVSLYFQAIRTSTGLARDGTLETAIAYNTAGLTIAYTRERAAMVTGTPVSLAAATTAWTSLGFIHVGGGLCRVDFPDAGFVTGVKFMVPMVYGPTDTSFIFVGLVDNAGVDPRSATAPDVNVTKVAGTTQTAGVDIAAKTNLIPASPAAVGSAMTLTSGERTSIGQAVWDALTSALTTVNSIGAWIVSKLDVVLSTRGTSTYAGGDTAGTTTLLSRITAAPPTAVQNADALLARNAAGGANSAPTVGTLLLMNDLKFSISGTTLTVYADDGVTVLATRTIARSAVNAIISAA